MSSFRPDMNQPATAIPIKTTENVIFHSKECGKPGKIRPTSSCAKTSTANLTPTQPTITNAATSNPGRLFNKPTNTFAAKRIIMSPIIPPAKITANCPVSKLPMFPKPVGGNATASATAAKMESTANAKSAHSTFTTVIQTPLPFFFDVVSCSECIKDSYKCLIEINNRQAAPKACTCQKSTRNEITNSDPKRSTNAP